MWYDRKGHTTYIDKLSVTKDRFFEWAGAIWLNRNCLYALSHLELIPQKAARRKYKASLKAEGRGQRAEGSGRSIDSKSSTFNPSILPPPSASCLRTSAFEKPSAFINKSSLSQNAKLARDRGD